MNLRISFVYLAVDETLDIARWTSRVNGGSIIYPIFHNVGSGRHERGSHVARHQKGVRSLWVPHGKVAIRIEDAVDDNKPVVPW
jgi:hypothetical protein